MDFLDGTFSGRIVYIPGCCEKEQLSRQTDEISQSRLGYSQPQTVDKAPSQEGALSTVCNAFAVNLLSTVDRRHDIINIDLIRKPNNHYRKMLGNGTEPKYTDVHFGDKGETVQSLPETVQKMVKEELF